MIDTSLNAYKVEMRDLLKRQRREDQIGVVEA